MAKYSSIEQITQAAKEGKIPQDIAQEAISIKVDGGWDIPTDQIETHPLVAEAIARYGDSWQQQIGDLRDRDGWS